MILEYGGVHSNISGRVNVVESKTLNKAFYSQLDTGVPSF